MALEPILPGKQQIKKSMTVQSVGRRALRRVAHTLMVALVVSCAHHIDSSVHSITVQRVLVRPATAYTYENLQGFELDEGIQFEVTRAELKKSDDMVLLYVEFGQLDANRLKDYVSPHLGEMFVWKFDGVTIEVSQVADISDWPYALFNLEQEFVDYEDAKDSLFGQ